MKIERITVDELFSCPEMDALCEEYGSECGDPKYGTPFPDKELYEKMDAIGMLVVVGAFDDDRLVGFASATVTTIPHYINAKHVAHVESLFLSKCYRKGYAGIGLIRHLQREALLRGAVSLFFNARKGSSLERIGNAIAQPTHTQFVMECQYEQPSSLQ